MNKQKVAIIFIAILGSVAIGARFLVTNDNSDSNNLNTQPQEAQSQIKTISAAEYDQFVKENDVFVIDVHTPEQTHLPSTDEFIPYDQITDNLDKLPQDKAAPILLYCRSGSMSQMAAQDLLELGYTNIYDLTGGTDAYKNLQTGARISPKTQDLGEVIYGDVSTTSFSLQNNTNKPLKITRVSTSCSCTSAEVSQTEIAPFSEAQVKVSFDPAVHGDDTDLGDIIRTIYIQTDNPDYETITATITAQVIK